MDGTPRHAGLLYDSGLRLLEADRPRVKDVELGRNLLVVRSGKGTRSGSRCCRASCNPTFASTSSSLAAGTRPISTGRGLRRAPRPPRPQAPLRCARMALAMGLPCDAQLSRSRDRRASPPPSPRNGGPEGRPPSRPRRRDPQARDVPHCPALVRDAPLEDGTDIRTLQELLATPTWRRSIPTPTSSTRGPSCVRTPVDRLLGEQGCYAESLPGQGRWTDRAGGVCSAVMTGELAASREESGPWRDRGNAAADVGRRRSADRRCYTAHVHFNVRRRDEQRASE